MRIRTILKAAAVPGIIAASLLGTSLAASASTGPVAPNGNAGHMTGNAASVYADPYFGPVSCNEVQHPAFDNVTCKAVAGVTTDKAGNPVAVKGPATLWRPAGESTTIGWLSDFTDGSGNGYAPAGPGAISQRLTGTLTYTVTTDALGNPTGYTGQVVYTS
jgi:hypothetical protein